MVKRKNEIIPRPKSLFIKIKCTNCAAEHITFDHSTAVVKCRNCNEILIVPTGGKAKIRAEIIAKYG
jgi:small subunit ribosomal protein S27e